MSTPRATEFRRNDTLETTLAALSDALAPAAAQATSRFACPRRPVVFVVGPPRCGSTHLLQRLVSSGSFAYPSNLISRFHSAPYLGALVHRILLDPSLDYRGELTGAADNPDGISSLGKTRGPANVNEFWYAWRPHLPQSDADEYTSAQLRDLNGAGLQAMVAGLEAGFDRPAALKAQILSFHLEELAELFPTALFLRLRRDPVELVASILAARVRHTGSEATWWSLRPLDVDRLVDLDPVDQVAHQVVAIENAISRAASGLGDRVIDVDHAALQRSPDIVDTALRRSLAAHGIDMAAPATLHSVGPNPLDDRDRDRLRAAVDRATAERIGPEGPHPVGDSQADHRDPSTAPFASCRTAGDVPPGDEHHLLLYSRQAFIERNLGPRDRWIRVDHHDGDRLVGSISGALTDGMVWSGHSAPFGGPNFVRPHETPANVTSLLDATARAAARHGARSLRITLRPPSYSPVEPLVLHAAIQKGFQVTHSELSCAIDIATMGSSDDYVRSLKRASRRDLLRHTTEPWSYEEVIGDWAEPYRLLADNRARKGRSLRLSLEYIHRVRDDHPGRLRCFELRHDGRPVAAALLYRLLDDVESVQYWGDVAPWLTFSPMRQLAFEVCATAISEGIRLVDLGKSSLDGCPDHGLVQFKRSLGAVAEPILTVEQRL